MTTAKLPPPPTPSSSTSATTMTLAATSTGAPLDPYILLNRLDHHRVTVGVASSAATSATSSSTTSSSSFDPIDFLNQHYRTEAVLSAQLPRLREAVTHRIETLQDNIANALQRQSETASTTRQHIRDSVASAAALERRVLLVRDKAAASEKTVTEITQELKRLDAAKRHLQRSITTLKRLHMLVHAVEELRLTARQQHPFPDYATAAHLVEATRLLLSHFEAYQARVEPMRRLSNKVEGLTEHMRLTLVRGFRIVAFGPAKAELLEATSSRKNKKPKAAAKAMTTATSRGAEDHDQQHGGGQMTVPSPPLPPRMTPAVMQGGVLFIDALGPMVRAQFIHDFCSDHLGDYLQEFQPPSNNDTNKQQPEKRVSSFKIVEKPPEPEPMAASLDAVEKRFIWFRHVLQVAFDDNFPHVFPPAWNVQAQMARHFLQLTRDHILALLEDNGPRRDADATNAQVLLKALRKTLVFEKEITAWLQRECGTVFKSSSSASSADDGVSKNINHYNDESKNSSRAMTPTTSNTGADGADVAIDPLMGVASSAFNDYMGPYIALEEQSMDEQLVEALEDRTVDNRGDRPVFISSTNLFGKENNIHVIVQCFNWVTEQRDDVVTHFSFLFIM
jgi:vacuolar protein sorting-associated protein 53